MQYILGTGMAVAIIAFAYGFEKMILIMDRMQIEEDEGFFDRISRQ